MVQDVDELRLSVSPAINATAQDDKEMAQPGFVCLVAPSILSGAAGKAGIYAVVTRRRGRGTRVDATVLWAGPVSDAGEEPSIPGVWVRKGDVIRLNAAAIRASVVVGCLIEMSSSPPGFSRGHIERPGERTGDLRTLTLGDPAAGAAYALVTVPAQALWRIVAAALPLILGAVSTFTRYAFVAHDDGTRAVGGTVSGRGVNATQNVTFFFARGGGISTNEPANNPGTGGVVGGSCPEESLEAGHRLQFGGTIDGTDNYGAGFAFIEEMAVI